MSEKIKDSAATVIGMGRVREGHSSLAMIAFLALQSFARDLLFCSLTPLQCLAQKGHWPTQRPYLVIIAGNGYRADV